MDLQELLHEYNRGERNFSNICLHKADLRGACLSGGGLQRS